MKKKIAVIGAGFSGLVLSNYLNHLNEFEVDIFERAGFPGGRLASHYYEDYFFDFGAQFFTARSSEFKKFLLEYIESKTIKPWQAKFVEYDFNCVERKAAWSDKYPHYVGVKSLNNFAKCISKNLNIEYGLEIIEIQKDGKKLKLKTKNNIFLNKKYDIVITATPPKNVLKISPKNLSYNSELNDINMSPCFALMLGFNNDFNFDFDAAHVKNSIISWMSLNNSKNDQYKNSITIMTTNNWALKNFEKDEAYIINSISNEFSKIIKKDLKPDFKKLKRWTYANSKKSNTPKFFHDTENNIFSCGDWCINGRVESSFLSAFSLYQHLTS